MGPFILLVTLLLNNIDNEPATQPWKGKESKFVRTAGGHFVPAGKTANSANRSAPSVKPLNLDRSPRRL